MYRRPFLSITNLIARDELVVLCEMWHDGRGLAILCPIDLGQVPELRSGILAFKL